MGMFSRLSLLSSILLLVGSVVAQNCDYCFDPGAVLSPECIAADPAIAEIIARDSSCGRSWDPFCIVEYNDCYNQACGVENQELINDIAATGGPGNPPRGLDRQQILDRCPPSPRIDTLSPTACPPGKGGRVDYNGGKKGGFYYEDCRADGKKGGKKGYNGYNDGRADGKKGGKKGGYGGYGRFGGKKNGDCYYGGGRADGKKGGKKGYGSYGGRADGKKGGKKGYYASDGGRNGGVVVEVVV